MTRAKAGWIPPTETLVKCTSVFLSIILVAVSIHLVWTARSNHKTRLQLAHSDLLIGNYQDCANQFKELATSFWVGSEAKVGEKICRIMSDEGVDAPVSANNSLEEINRFPIRHLLHQSLTSSHYKACLDLARFTGLVYGKEAPLYESAALLELGNREESRALFESLPIGLKQSPLGIRLTRVHKALADDARAVLQDRRGQPIGWVTTDQELRLLEGIDPELLPLDTIEKVLDERPASSVRLSIDLELSKIAKRALRGYRGSIVLLEPYTGEILAAVSDKWTGKRLSDPALNELLEPASISKLITTSAAMRAHLNPDMEISRMRCQGALHLEGDYLWCPSPGGRLKGLNHAMASSCNVAFANLGLMIGSKVVMDELQRFGFNHVSEDGLILGKVLDQPEKKIETADLSIGLEHTQCTPVHGAIIASVFANGGYRVEPTLFSARDGLLGISKQQDLEVQKERILPEEWLEPLQQSMLAVVNWGGTAHGIVPSDFPVAMKTGTAATPGLGYHTNYIGFGPVEDVKIAFCVRITRIRSSKTAGQASRGATGRLLRYLAKNSELLNSHSRDELLPWTVAFEADDE